jgi:S-formylglutathione hydrolase FrmB
VFADSGGTFNTDTGCVDGPRGNAAAHLTMDVRPFVVDRFGASADPRQWGVAGWSMGGTCALDLAVMHPELFSTFDDIGGDQGPVAGNKQQTIERLFAGDAAAWARYDPATVLAGHPPYPNSAGVIDASDGTGPAVGEPPTAVELEAMAALIKLDRRLCTLATKDGMACVVHVRPGRHSWKSGSAAFAEAFPWMADRLANPGAPAAVPPSPTS